MWQRSVKLDLSEIPPICANTATFDESSKYIGFQFWINYALPYVKAGEPLA